MAATVRKDLRMDFSSDSKPSSRAVGAGLVVLVLWTMLGGWAVMFGLGIVDVSISWLEGWVLMALSLLLRLPRGRS